MKKILLIQLKQIGDCLMTTPAIRAIKKANPEVEIHYLTQKPSDQLFANNPYLDQVHCYPKSSKITDNLKAIAGLRQEKFDLVLDFEGLPKSAVISWLCGAKKRVGFNYRGRKLFYTHIISSEPNNPYAPAKKLELLKGIEIHATDTQLEFYLSSKDHDYAANLLTQLKVDPSKPIISISPVSRRDYKVWPAENFAWVADKLITEKQAQILFLWGPGEMHFIEAVRNHMKEKDLGDYKIPSISETAAIFTKMDLHLGNDNGPMHFAIAAKKPTIAIFGKPQALNWTPESDQHTGLEFDPGCKNSCHYPDCKLECLGVEKELVWERAKEKLGNL